MFVRILGAQAVDVLGYFAVFQPEITVTILDNDGNSSWFECLHVQNRQTLNKLQRWL